MLLGKKEKILMETIFKLASKTGQCIVSAIEILEKIPYKYDFRKEDLDKTLDALRLEGYFEYDIAHRKDETVYVIVLKDLGKAYERDKKTARKKLYIRLGVAVLVAIVGYLVKVIIDAII